MKDAAFVFDTWFWLILTLFIFAVLACSAPDVIRTAEPIKCTPCSKDALEGCQPNCLNTDEP